MNDATLALEGEVTRGWGMNVGAVAARLGGGVEKEAGDVTMRRGSGEAILGGVEVEEARTGMAEGEEDCRRGMPEGEGMLRCVFS